MGGIKEKEVAFICCIIREKDLFNGSLFGTFDEIYEASKEFVDKNGVLENIAFEEFEDMIIQFVKNKNEKK